MNNRVKSDMPYPLLDYIGSGKFRMREDFSIDDSATTHWLIQDNGETYRLEWWGNGWVVFYQESYLLKTLAFAHKNDIPSFSHSHFGDADGWLHVFETRMDAVEAFKAQYLKLRGIEPCGDERLYHKPLDNEWDDDVYTIEDWKAVVADGMIDSDDGSGYWVKDGLKSDDEVFSTPQLDATHVVWYNK